MNGQTRLVSNIVLYSLQTLNGAAAGAAISRPKRLIIAYFR